MVLPSTRRTFAKRYVVTCLIFLGFTTAFYVRTNLSIAIVDMTSPRNITEGNLTYEKKAEFDWSPREKGLILGSYLYGYFFSPIGGMLAVKYGGATVFGSSILLSAVLNTLVPLLSRLNIYVFIAFRVLGGIFEASSLSSYAEIFAQWAPPHERARLISFAFSGVFLGCTINYPISGFIAKAYGWEIIFYLSGFVSFLWYIVWIYIVKNRPSLDKRMSVVERSYIEKKINRTQHANKKIIYPWKAMLSSKTVWAYFMHRFTMSWLSVFIVIYSPLYFKGLYKLDINELGIISGIPHICSLISQTPMGMLFDYIRNKHNFSIATVYKIFTCSSYLGQSIILLVVGRWPSYVISIICFSAIRVIATAGESTSYTLSVDMAPKYAGFLAGIGTTCYCIGSVLSPILLLYVCRDQQDPAMWNQYFLVISGINLLATFSFWRYGSGKQEAWNDLDTADPDVAKSRSKVEPFSLDLS